MTSPLTVQLSTKQTVSTKASRAAWHTARLVPLAVAAALTLTACTSAPGASAPRTTSAPMVSVTAKPVPAATTGSVGSPKLLRDDVSAPGTTAVTAGAKQTVLGPVVAWRAVLTARDTSATAKEIADAVSDVNAGSGWDLVSRRTGSGYRLTADRSEPGVKGAAEHLVIDVVSPATGVPVMVRVLHATVAAS